MRIFVLLSVFSFGNLQAQRTTERIKLSEQLNEISGLALLNDSILMAINDSGNSPDLYFLDTSGRVIKTTHLSNAFNTDWEDLTMDQNGNLFIADVGNNLNDRKNLHILKLSAIEAFQKDTVKAQKIQFMYPDQTEFPPDKSAFKFNCEAVFWLDDSLYLLTKNESRVPKERNNKWSREPSIYVIPDLPGAHIAHPTNWLSKEVFKVKKRGLAHLITSATTNNLLCYILTYKHLFVFKWGKTAKERQPLYHRKFIDFKQREAIAVTKDGTIYIGAEKHALLGGPFLYVIRNIKFQE